MTQQKVNFFIIDENKIISGELRKDLQKRFDSKLDLSVCYDREVCLEKANEEVDVVMIIAANNKKNYAAFLDAIETLSPNAKVIMHSPNDDIGKIVESFQFGSADPYVKKARIRARIIWLLNKYVADPILLLAKEFGISKYAVIFLLTFFIVGVIVMLFLEFYR